MLGAWIACSYFYILRDYVHQHVENLTNGRSHSSKLVYFALSTLVWLAFMITIIVTFLAVRSNEILKFDVEDFSQEQTDCFKKATYL